MSTALTSCIATFAHPASVSTFRQSMNGYRSAEREGFEPSVRLPVHMISNHAPSATRSSLLGNVSRLRRAENRRNMPALLARLLDNRSLSLHVARRRAVRVAEGA